MFRVVVAQAAAAVKRACDALYVAHEHSIRSDARRRCVVFVVVCLARRINENAGSMQHYTWAEYAHAYYYGGCVDSSLRLMTVFMNESILFAYSRELCLCVCDLYYITIYVVLLLCCGYSRARSSRFNPIPLLPIVYHLAFFGSHNILMQLNVCAFVRTVSTAFSSVCA